jgi:rhodanese-related sulfurtransferase
MRHAYPENKKPNQIMRAAMLLAFLAVLMFALAACGGSGSSDPAGGDQAGDSGGTMDARYTHLSMEDAQAMIESGTPGEDYILLDTRQLNVYKHDHIPGAICIPDTEITSLPDDAEIEELPDKDQKIIVYCQFGGVSKVASEKLCDMGYTNVYEFDGMDYWEGEVEYGDDYE